MKNSRALSAIQVCGLVCMLSGCCSDCGRMFRDRCADIAPGLIPQPVGAHTCAWQTTQGAIAERDDFVIYQYEWIGETAELSPFGNRHVDELVRRLESQPYQMTIEPSEGNPSLDAHRRMILIGRLNSYGVVGADARVSIDYAAAEGLIGPEGPGLYSGYLRSGSRAGGGGGGLGTSGGFGTSGGTSGGGFGGGGIY